MSRCYKIKIAGVNLNVHENKDVFLDIDVIPILEKEKMQEIFKNLAEKNEWQIEDNKVRIVQGNGVEYEVDLDDWKVKLHLEPALKNAETTVDAYEEQLPKQVKNMANGNTIELDLSQLDGKVLESMQKIIGLSDADVRKVILQETLKGRQFINQVMKDVYKEAVKQKAQSMGNITSISESSQEGEYRIRVEIQ